MLLVLWAHYEVMTSNPGIVPTEIRAIAPNDHAEDGQSLQESDGDDGEEDDGAQVEEEMLLHEFEDQEDDGSLLIFCDQCGIYRPSRYESITPIFGALLKMDERTFKFLLTLSGSLRARVCMCCRAMHCDTCERCVVLLDHHWYVPHVVCIY